MIIDINYILKRIDFLISENWKNQKKAIFSNKIDSTIPIWLLKFLRPIYRLIKPYYIGIQQIKRDKEKIHIPLLHPIALNFMKYFFVENQKPYFDTSIYFEENQDEEIIDFLDNRIQSVVAGLGKKEKTAIQEEDIRNNKYINSKIKKGNDGFYCLNLDGDNEYVLPVKNFATDVFVRHYGLKELTEKQKKYIEGKDFLDIGAYYGDTGLMFLNYKPHCIYAYEPVKSTFDFLLKAIQKNNNSIIIPINKGVGEKDDIITIFSNTFDASCSSIVYEQSTSNSQQDIIKEQIEIVTIDEECKNKKIGLIKMDIEGFEYYAIKGGLKTIQRDKPILLISIYHTAKDFFEIPPMIRSVCPDYKFKYIDICPSNPIADKILIAYT